MIPYVTTDDIRDLFSHAMSAMYQAEVPLYGDLLRLVAEINARTLVHDRKLADSLRVSGELARLTVERHGAIRVGTAAELAMLRRVFAVMGMQAVDYYDLSKAGVPVHSTAFRPIDAATLTRNPFRVFTSLLRLDLIANTALREQAEQVLAKRDIFTPRVRALIQVYEDQGGLSQSQAHEFVAEALYTFRWHHTATVDFATYQALHQAHPLIADVVCFRGPHINHLTPRTLDIDAAQRQMLTAGIDTKALIEGPPARHCPILLRQTSFKALAETIRFADHTSGVHSARFGEIEQRGAALTAKGRALYDGLLAKANSDSPELDNDAHQRQLSTVFSAFPDTLLQLHEQKLAFFNYHLTAAGLAARGQYRLDRLPDAHTLVSTGLLSITPITYEDFLPVSAAGIFQSNLTTKSGSTSQQMPRAKAEPLFMDAEFALRCITLSQATFERALGGKITDSQHLYAEQARQSYQIAINTLLTKDKVD